VPAKWAEERKKKNEVKVEVKVEEREEKRRRVYLNHVNLVIL